MVKSVARLKNLKNSPLAAYTGPFVVFMLLLEVIRSFRIENGELPWWRQFPEHWGFPLQVFVCFALLWICRKSYPAFSAKGLWTGVIAGVGGIVIWLLPPVLYEWGGIGGEGSWLDYLGVTARLEGFNPYVFGGDNTGLPFYILIFLRFLRLVIIVSLVEEIFWRGFLMRWISQSDVRWIDLPLQKCSIRSVFLTAGAFAVVHAGPDCLVAFIYGLLAGWVALRSGNLWAVVVMHMTANLCLGVFIMKTGWFGLW